MISIVKDILISMYNIYMCIYIILIDDSIYIYNIIQLYIYLVIIYNNEINNDDINVMIWYMTCYMLCAICYVLCVICYMLCINNNNNNNNNIHIYIYIYI